MIIAHLLNDITYRWFSPLTDSVCCFQKSDELRSKVDSLTSELAESRSSHKRTLTEAAALREKERKQNQVDGEKLAVSHRAELEEVNKKHARELEKLTNKTNSRIKMIEEEFNDRFQQNSEVCVFQLFLVYFKDKVRCW